MYKLLCICCLLFVSISCNSTSITNQPEPHLELGQRINFMGGNSAKSYIVAGYRDQYDDKTESEWNKQAYIVFTYFNDQGDFMQGIIHKNAILKE